MLRFPFLPLFLTSVMAIHLTTKAHPLTPAPSNAKRTQEAVVIILFFHKAKDIYCNN